MFEERVTAIAYFLFCISGGGDTKSLAFKSLKKLERVTCDVHLWLWIISHFGMTFIFQATMNT